MVVVAVVEAEKIGLGVGRCYDTCIRPDRETVTQPPTHRPIS